MADTAPVAAAPAASPKAKKPKSPKKTSGKPKVAASHPTYSDMVRRAITDLKDKKGSSRAAILKYILQHFKVGGNVISINSHIRQALKRGVVSGALKQVKGVGASGSFRIGEKAVKPKAAKKTTKKAAGTKKAAKPKTAGAAKPKSPKKKTAKKPKAAGTKSPKKAKAAKPKKAKAAPKKAKASPKKAAPKKTVKKAKAPKTTPAATA